MVALRALALLLAAACTNPVPPRLSAIEQRIFAPNCAFSSCHSVFGAAGALVLAPGRSFAQLVSHSCAQDAARAEGLLRVVPGDPAHSFLLMKLHTIDPKYGDRMPQNALPLDDSDLSSIEEWIREGAQDN